MGSHASVLQTGGMPIGIRFSGSLSAPCLNENVFICQLERRPTLLDSEFQTYLIHKIKMHATKKCPDEFFNLKGLEHNMLHHHIAAASSVCPSMFPFSMGSDGSNENFIACDFYDSVGVVEVVAAPIKSISRMKEKLMEYATEGHSWPLPANIQDPVRASIVCEYPTQILQVLNWFVGGNSDEKFTVIRIKNKFAFPVRDLVGGYRDLQVFMLFVGSYGIKIIAEIQIQDILVILHSLKLKVFLISFVVVFISPLSFTFLLQQVYVYIQNIKQAYRREHKHKQD